MRKVPSARALEEYLGLAHFDPDLHPRNRLGRFSDALTPPQRGPLSHLATVVPPLTFKVEDRKGMLTGQTLGQESLDAFDADGKRAGYLTYATRSPDGSHSILSISVEPDQRRKGVATAMFDEMRRSHPGWVFNHTMTTPEGTAWKGDLPKGWQYGRVPSWKEDPRTVRQVLDDEQAANPVDIGVTPYRGKGKATGTDYFDTPRYKGFENTVPVAAEALGLMLHGQVERAQGVWAGGEGPSAKVRVSGDQAKVREFMDQIGSRYNQDAVIAWQDRSNGPHKRFISEGKIDPAKVERAIAAVNKGKSETDSGYIQGATVRPDGRLELIDLHSTHESVGAMIDLFKGLGATFKYSRGYGTLRFKGSDYEARTDARRVAEARGDRGDQGRRPSPTRPNRGDLLLKAARAQAQVDR